MALVIDLPLRRHQRQLAGLLAARDWDGLMVALYAGASPMLPLPDGTALGVALMREVARSTVPSNTREALLQRYAVRAVLEGAPDWASWPASAAPWRLFTLAQRPDVLTVLCEAQVLPSPADQVQAASWLLARRPGFAPEAHQLAVALVRAWMTTGWSPDQGEPPLSVAAVRAHDGALVQALQILGQPLGLHPCSVTSLPFRPRLV